MSLLAFENVQIEYEGKKAVKGVSFQVRAGETFVIAGESGSGKTTLIKSVMGLLGTGGKIKDGIIRIDGQDIAEIPPEQLHRLRGRELGMVFQNSETAFCPVKTVGQAVHEFMCREKRVSREAAYKAAEEIMLKMGFQNPGEVLGKYPFELSGGMNQRIGIMLALLGRPRLIFADEPTSALDAVTQKQVLDELLKLKAETGTAMVLITHNMGVARYIADTIGIMQNGRMVEVGPKEEIIGSPKHEYTKKLLGSVPGFGRV